MPESHEDLLQRLELDGLPRPAVNITNLSDEAQRIALDAAEKTGAASYVLAQSEEDLRRLLDEYAAVVGRESLGEPSDVDEALESAVSAIYFADSSDYYRALWEVIGALDRDLAEKMEDDPRAVFEEMQERVT